MKLQSVDLQDTLNHAQISHRNGRPTYDPMAYHSARYRQSHDSPGMQESQPNTCDGVSSALKGYLVDIVAVVMLISGDGMEPDGVEPSGEHPLNRGRNHF
jgi:hypothetical protein